MKTALYYLLREMSREERSARAADIAASYRAAVVEPLVTRLVAAGRHEGVRTLAISGGVAANSLLRRRLEREGVEAGFHVVIPAVRLCTDNAAMIAAAALSLPALAFPDYLELEASASLPLPALREPSAEAPRGEEPRQRPRPESTRAGFRALCAQVTGATRLAGGYTAPSSVSACWPRN